METIAVYWESRVKIYSITELKKLTLATISFPVKLSEYIAEKLILVETEIKRFELVTQDYLDCEHTRINLFFKQTNEAKTELSLAQFTDKGQDISTSFTAPIELVFLHGPHFQDRFGIINVAFSALETHNIEVIASGCAGTSIYIVLPAKKAGHAAQILADTFLIPTSKH